LPSAVDSEIAELRGRLDPARLPEHVAIIMDGNGRWSREKRLPSRLLGHAEGYRTLRRIVRAASDLGIKVLTCYVFSNENWRRPKHEVDGLMSLIEHAARTELRDLHANNVRIRFIGRRSGLPDSLLRQMDEDMAVTQANTGLVLNLALNYGGRTEIVDAARLLAEEAARGTIRPEDITEESISARLYSPPGMPEPDLLIRTAGEMRISNFLLWGIAYSEIYVTPALWPDFSPAHLVDALVDYGTRVRKFGAVAP
jgi:undecaprenyl diphosphate synthase